jgi:hypothetical protein
MNLSLWDAALECYMLKHPHKPFPVNKALTTKKKGEASKCKTCVHFKSKWFECSEPMKMACEKYKRKKKRK